MLAQNFKPATDLGISEAEHSALIRVLGMLERNEMVYSDEHHPAPGEFGFFMGCQFKKHDCGSLGCIGGWVATFIGHRSPRDYVNRFMNAGALHDLYWGYYGDPSVEQGAHALRNFLTTGRARWCDVVKVN